MTAFTSSFGLTLSIFACGACEVRNKYFVYYGGADSVVCVATVDKEEMLGIF